MPSRESARRQRGILADWNDERGFGFIRPATGGPRLFVHVSAFPRSHRPAVGCEVSYTETRDERARACAGAVQYVTPPPHRKPRKGGIRSGLVVAGIFFGVLGVLVLQDTIPAILLVAYGLLSAVTFFAYGEDKSAAEKGRWRTPESTLHLLALVGGWPGALMGQRYFRHKTKKQPFHSIFWLTVVANGVALAWFALEMPVTLP